LGITAAVVLSFLLISCWAGPRDATPGDGPGPVDDGSTYRLEVDASTLQFGFTLVSPQDINQSFLIDEGGKVVHRWYCKDPAQGPSYMLGDGTILRCMSGSGPRSLGFQLLDWNGSVLWTYRPPRPYARHHDIEPLPNGNVLVIVREVYTLQQAVAIGRHPSLLNDTFWVDSLIEVRQNGSDRGDIVWRWDPTDHLVQDWDEMLGNYGNVSAHAELLDINLPEVNTRDWLHLNAVDYNPELDQIMITSRNYNEVWVVDHNTTMEEASGHTGGAHGMGGDLLYRWGNPQAYDGGDADDQVLYGPHDGHWVPKGMPGEGNVLVFNNGRNQWDERPEGRYSTVDEFAPPVNGSGGYDRGSGAAFGPTNLTWRYQAFPATNFFAGSRSGAQRLPDGNTLVSDGPKGRLFVVTPGNGVVWTYITGPLFKALRNFAPSMDMPGNLTATEDVPMTLDLSSSIHDPDTGLDDLVLDIETPHGSVTGYTVDLLFPEGVTREAINFTLCDGIFLTRGELVVNVTPVNDPPIMAPLPELDLFEDVLFILDLGPYIFDPDDPLDDLTVTATSQYVVMNGTFLEALYPEGVLTDVVEVSVRDAGFEAVGHIDVNITPVNDPPVITGIPDIEVTEDVTSTLDITPFISDVDTPLTNLSVSVDSPYASVEGMVVSITCPEGVLHHIVNVTVGDGEFEVDTTITVTVEPVDDAPTISSLPDLAVDEDVTATLDLETYIADVDTPLGELSIGVDSRYVLVDGRSLVLEYPEGVMEDTVTVTVSDGTSTASTTLLVTVRPVNDPPRWTKEMRLEATEDVPTEVDLVQFLEDTDTDVGDLRVTGGSAYAVVTGLRLDLLFPEGVLEDEFQLTLSDGEFETAARVSVTVTPVNDAPELMGAGVSPGAGDEGTVFVFTVLAIDPDSEPGDIVVKVVIDGTEHPCTGTQAGNGTVYNLSLTLPAGQHVYHFVADDGAGGQTTTTPLDISVSERPPEDNGGHRDGDDLSYIYVAILLVAMLVIAAVVLGTSRSKDQGPGP